MPTNLKKLKARISGDKILLPKMNHSPLLLLEFFSDHGGLTFSVQVNPGDEDYLEVEIFLPRPIKMKCIKYINSNI